MKGAMARRAVATAACWALPLSLLSGGCGSTKPCKTGTLFVTVLLDAATRSGDQVSIQLTTEGQPARQSLFDHRPGAPDGTIEIDFPEGYPAGKHVDLRIVIEQAGAPIGAGVAALNLGDGCSAAMVSVSAGVVDGGGVDGQGGAGGAPVDAAADAAGDSAAGAGGGDAGPGRPDGAVDLPSEPTCTFHSAEDCYNGIDDDCNGLTDCQDPACAPVTACVPGISGSNGFVAGVWVDAAASCPARFDAGETGINATLDPGAGCTGCSCSATISCSANLYKYLTAAACNGDTALTGGSLAGAVSTASPCLASTFNTLTEARVGPFGTTNGPCTPQGIAAPTPPTWGTSRKFCGAGSVGAGCGPGYVCLPKAVPNHCALALGAKSCPAGYTKDGGSWYTGFDDTRSCGACACGSQTPGSCQNLLVRFYAGTTTTCSAGIHRSLGPNAKECGFGISCGSAGFDGTPTAPTCPPVSAVTGAAAPTGEQTLCCQ
jgi:hypothetical protein